MAVLRHIAGDTYAHLVNFLHQQPQITAVFALTAEMARLTYQALHKEEGLNASIHLVSFDDPEIPNLPHILQDEERMGRSAVDLLLEQFSVKYTPQRVEIPVKWISG